MGDLKSHDLQASYSIIHGLEVFHVSGLNFACQLISNTGGLKSHDLQASSRKLEVNFGLRIFASKLIALGNY